MTKSLAIGTPKVVRGFCSMGLLAAALSSACWWLGVRLNLTASMPVGFYRVVRGATERNVIVLICLPESIAEFAHERGYLPNGSCRGGVAPIGKRIVAVPGDTVAMTQAGLQVNGVLIPNSKSLPRDGRHRQLPELTKQLSIVAPHQLWVLSWYSSRSFDSRYFGPIPDSAVQATIRPLLTQH